MFKSFYHLKIDKPQLKHSCHLFESKKLFLDPRETDNKGFLVVALFIAGLRGVLLLSTWPLSLCQALVLQIKN